ncbi:Histone-lysine N-methyltransferase H3 lysine-9 specific SUVH5 [Bienertia sinuspersici]
MERYWYTSSERACFCYQHEMVDQETILEPYLPSIAWNCTGMLGLKEPAFAVKHDVEPVFAMKSEVMDEGTSIEPCLQQSSWKDTVMFHLKEPAFAIEHEVVDRGTSLEPCLPSAAWNYTGILDLREPAFAVKHEVLDEESSVETCLLQNPLNPPNLVQKDTAKFMGRYCYTSSNEPAFAIEHEMVDKGTSLEPCLPSTEWNDTGIHELKEPTFAVKTEVVDEGTSVETCLLPNHLNPINLVEKDTDAVKTEVVDEGTSVETCLLPNHLNPINLVQKDTGILHLEEPVFAVKSEVMDEGTSTEPCLQQSSCKDTGILHLKEPVFAIEHEVVDNGASLESCLPSTAWNNTAVNNEVVDEGTSVESCLLPNHPNPPNLVQKEQSFPSRKRASPVCDVSAGCGHKSTRLVDTQDKHLFRCETVSDDYRTNVRSDVNQIKEEPDADNTFMDKIQQGVITGKSRDGAEDSSRRTSASVQKIKQAPMLSKANEIKGQDKNSKDINDEQGMQRGCAGSNRCNVSSNKSDARRKVRDTLRLFHGVLRKLYINTKKMMGPVPGVEIGDLFNYRVELDIIGLHKPIQSGIDFIKQDDKIFAISVVASGRYDNDVVSCDMLIYTGQGGNVAGGCKQLEDQKLERGNLALKNSIVERYWHEPGRFGKLIYKFELRRVPHQVELTRKKVKQPKKSKIRKGACKDSNLEGIETSICVDITTVKKTQFLAVNDIDDQKPHQFTYITEVIYPDWCRPIPLRAVIVRMVA